MRRQFLCLSRGRLAAIAALAGIGTLGVVALPLAPGALAQQEVADYGRFYDELEQYGRWIEHPRFGYVWSPEADDGTWRPYTVGHWVRTEEHGWYWESEEPWGWATYHYGRWVLDDNEGWLWIPGREWGPAWVAWRDNDEYVGWAPLPPEAIWEQSRGELNFASSYYDAPRFAPMWCFIRPAYLMTPGLHRHLAPRSRASFIYRETRFINSYSVVNRGVFNRGVDVRTVERAINRPVVPVSILRASSPREHGGRRGSANSGAISVYRPNIVAPSAGAKGPAPRSFVPAMARPEGMIGRGDAQRGNHTGQSLPNRTPAMTTPPESTVQRAPPNRPFIRPEGHSQPLAAREPQRDFNRQQFEPRPVRPETQTEQRPPSPSRFERPLPQPPVARQAPPPMTRHLPPQAVSPVPQPPVARQAPPQVARQVPPHQPGPQPGQPPHRKAPAPGQEGQPPR